MLLKRNLLETLTITCCTGTVVCVFLNYVTNISPITGVWLHLYIFILFILSISSSLKLLKWLLRLNRPIKYDLETLAKDHPFLSGFVASFRKSNQGGTEPKKRDDYKEYDTNELSVISTVLERKLVSSWYVPYISQEIGFPFACKQILDQIIGKGFQICHKIETKDVYKDICSILISHLKEYRKAITRHEKSPSTPIEDLYKKSHSTFYDKNKKTASGDHCTSILRLILKELVPWELWDTPYSELLVRILSKKLDSFIDTTLADPRWLNDKLLAIICKEVESDIKPVQEPGNDLNEDASDNIIVTEDMKEIKDNSNAEPVFDANNDTVKINEEAKDSIETEFPVILPKCIQEEVKVNGKETDEELEEDKAVEMVEEKSPVLRQRRGRQGKNEVKIYDRVIEGSVKTWETDMDLQCISLGQDLLASLDGEITLSRLWGQDTEPDGSPNPPRRKSPQPLWFGEEDTIDMELTDSSPHKSPKKEISPKPAELLKELQTTVHQAKTKIGDLQVDAFPSGIAVATNTSGDEAAGMMEGLLDFGIAGFKKGLRFTGLSDDTQEKESLFPSHKERSSAEKQSPISDLPLNKAFHDVDHGDHNGKDNGIAIPLQKEENGTSVPILTKQQRVSSQDSMGLQTRSKTEASLPVLVPGDSPEPQYEEAADLSTSIAKLRSLLQQRDLDATSTRSEEIWWQTAEETRGHTQRHHSSRPVDAAALADEYDMNAAERSSPGQTSNNIQRLDKLFHRTVTGVFNSIRTAVGAEGEEAGEEGEEGERTHHWTFVCAGGDQGVSGAIGRLVGGRRAAAHVDAALDSLDHLGAPPPKPSAHIDDEEWCSLNSRAACLAELACAASLVQSHVSRRIAALLLQDLAEPFIDSWLEDLSTWLQDFIFNTFRQMSDEDYQDEETALREMDVEETCAVLMEKIPVPLTLFGEDTLTESVRLTVSSFSHKEVNKDLALRLLDIFAVQFKTAAATGNTSFEN